MGHCREPIKHTCPEIDKLVEGVKEINKLLRGHEDLYEAKRIPEEGNDEY